MFTVREATITAVTLLLAGATGHLMQNAESLGPSPALAAEETPDLLASGLALAGLSDIQQLAGDDPDPQRVRFGPGLMQSLPAVTRREMTDTFSPVMIPRDALVGETGFRAASEIVHPLG